MKKVIVVGTTKQIAEGFSGAIWSRRGHEVTKIATDDDDVKDNPIDLALYNLNNDEANLVLIHRFQGSRSLTERIKDGDTNTIIVACGIGVEGQFDYVADTSTDEGRAQLASLVAEFDDDSLRHAPILIGPSQLRHAA